MEETFYKKDCLTWIKNHMFEFDHDILSNIAIGLMAQGEKDEHIWRIFI